MSRVTPARIAWTARRAFAGLGLAGWCGVALAVLGLAVLLAGWLPARDAAQRLRDDNDRLASRASGGSRADGGRNPSGQSADASPEAQLRRFYAGLLGDGQSAVALAGLQRAARHNGVPVEQAALKLVRDPDAQLARYEILLPVRTDYRRLRAFLSELLRDVPGSAIEAIDFRRDDGQAQAPEAHLRLVVWLSSVARP